MEQLLARDERTTSALATVSQSPVASERVRALALRAVEGAPALTQGEIRELAQAVIEHNDFFVEP